uniref:Death domain-containing protein n=1 Tax=Ciona intestinalis TaxID=7719 RepID=F6ZJN0_CIOIN
MLARSIIGKHRKLLISNIVDSGMLTENLYGLGILKERQYQIIQSQRIQLDKTIKILDCVQLLSAKDFVVFCQVLSEDYPWLAKTLLDCVKLNEINEDVTQTTSFLEKFGEEIPPEKQLMRWSRTLCKFEWENVFYELGYTSSDIEYFKQSENTPPMQCMKGLVQWLRNEGKSANFNALFQALKGAELQDICGENLIQICTGPT